MATTHVTTITKESVMMLSCIVEGQSIDVAKINFERNNAGGAEATWEVVLPWHHREVMHVQRHLCD